MRRTLCCLLLISVAACGGTGSAEDDAVAGPCFVTYADPAFVISGARNSVTSAPIGAFALQGIKLDGAEYFLTLRQAALRNATIAGDTVQCATGCGFAVQEGSYTFTVSAPGYVSKSVEVNAKYSSVVGSCPTSYSGPTSVSIALEPGL